MLTLRKICAGAAIAGLVALGATAGTAWANHIRIEVGGGTTVTMPAPANPDTLRAEKIRAQQVRANTIYANKIEADDVQGTIHQTSGVKIRDAEGKIMAPEVMASVIYADEIHANSVTADQIYAREIHRK